MNLTRDEDMHSKYAICMISAILLVPFVYATSSIPNVCAVSASNNYVTSKDCTGTLSGMFTKRNR